MGNKKESSLQGSRGTICKRWGMSLLPLPQVQRGESSSQRMEHFRVIFRLNPKQVFYVVWQATSLLGASTVHSSKMGPVATLQHRWADERQSACRMSGRTQRQRLANSLVAIVSRRSNVLRSLFLFTTLLKRGSCCCDSPYKTGARGLQSITSLLVGYHAYFLRWLLSIDHQLLYFNERNICKDDV